MTKFLASAIAIAFTASAMAQDTNPNLHQFVRFDTANATNSWKVNAPTTASDHFSVDFGSAVNGQTLTAMLADGNNTGANVGTMILGVYENCAVGTPNLSAALATRTGASPVGDPLNDDNSYTLACVVAGSPPNGYSATVTFPAGDSNTWLSSDSASGGTNSYFTTTNYAGCATIGFTGVSFHVGLGTKPAAGTLLVNGSSSASVPQDGGQACLVFYGPAFKTPGILFLLSPLTLKLIAISTDGFAPGPCPNSWALCQSFTCADFAPIGLTFGHFYFDTTDLKLNGKPKIKLATAKLGIDTSANCVPSFGQKDDCILDATIWKVQNPAGSSDWFNVNHGTTAGVGVSNLTGIEISSWDFCGTGPSWAEVGVYDANLGLDAAGCTPGNGVATAANAAMAPNAGDWGCPSTFYDVPDTAANSSTIYHVAARWQTGDSCAWLGSDTDGIDSGLGQPIPNNGCCSLFTIDSYSTSAVRFTAANWMMQVKWN
jgi:hypothetical protein